MNIGDFELTKDGGWIGTIHTMTINAKVRLVPNNDRATENAPAFHVFIGDFRVGSAWEGRRLGNAPQTYLRVHIDDPVLNEPINAALFPTDRGNMAKLVWNRRRENE